jgi:hypothetical protein
MKVLDPGHTYELATLDGGTTQELRFVKRMDPLQPWRFPGNTSAYPGTTLQNVLRACLERFRYLQGQIACPENYISILLLRTALWLLEFRAARRHGRTYFHGLSHAETTPMCPQCGHTECGHASKEEG